MEIQNPAPDRYENLHIHYHLKKVLVQFWPPAPSHPGPGKPETLKAEGNIFEKCLQNKRCAAGSKDS